MMNRFIFIVIILFSIPALSEDIATVDSIKIKGLKNINKYDLLRGVKTAVKNGEIHIDRDSLKNALDSEVMIDNYIVTEKNRVLIVDIIENYPLYVVVFSHREGTVPCLVDRKQKIIESGIFFKTDMPIIEMRDRNYDDDNDLSLITGLTGILFELKREQSKLLNELKVLSVLKDGKINVSLKGRRTRLLIDSGRMGFKKLESAVKVLDSTGKYPEFLDLTRDFVLIR